MAVVYTSATLSLAALEYFVNLEFATAPTDLVAVPAGIPDGVSRTEIADAALPPGWRAYPAPDRLAHVGSAWPPRADRRSSSFRPPWSRQSTTTC